ncbi:4-alpha-glucanotransferase [Actinomadura scrupuli]|uniref:4-alpha-glucanotransferase n=1 Tax=Actinomadura scrupuli TaxID=559629 RepID=UPI003D950F74
MTDQNLARLARAHDVATGFTDWRGEHRAVSPETLVAVLAALGVDGSSPAAVRHELERLDAENRTRLLPPVVVYRADGVQVETFTGGDPDSLRTTREPDEIWIPTHTDAPVEAWVELDPRLGGSVPLRGGTPMLACGREPAESRLIRVFTLPAGTPLGWHRIHAEQSGRRESAALLVTPSALTPPDHRAWGFMAQLYSVRSRASWGLGDLADLRDLAEWSGRALGAGFVLVNPLHAGEPVAPISPSPYLPMSRRFTSPLYLRIEDIPGYGELDPADRELISTLAAPLRARDLTLDELDRDAVWAGKRPALELLYDRTTRRPEAYEAYRAREGAALTSFATWCALAEEFGADWRRWPAELHDAEGPAVAAQRGRLARRVDFHGWLQWLLDEQLGAAQRGALAAGMPIGVVHDLAVGVHPGGADAWTHQRLFAPGMTVGAPPDEFNQRGQGWGQPPWHPGRLAAEAYAPLRGQLEYALRHAGGLRLDHAMQVSRLWWVPEGRSPDEGTYVGYDRSTILSVLTYEAHRAGALLVGEDLGTVEPEVRIDLAERNILGTSLLWFERDDKGAPRRPEQWRPLSLATVGTHDMPPLTGHLHGDHVELRERLALLTRPPATELADHHRQLSEWLDLLHELGLLPDPASVIMQSLDDSSRDHEGAARGAAVDRARLREVERDVVAALHGFLARTPALLLGVSLADAVGERRTQNQPGTTDEYPNWRVPLADAEGRPVLIEDLVADPGVRAAVAPLRGARAAKAE